jgi:K+-sensing histidine kinase KdpD
MDARNGITAVLIGVLIFTLFIFAAIGWLFYDIYKDVWEQYKAAPDATDRITAVVSSFDKTITTLVAFLTALATGILGYLGGSQGKKEAQAEAKESKDTAQQTLTAFGDLSAAATSTQQVTPAIVQEIKARFPGAFGTGNR